MFLAIMLAILISPPTHLSISLRAVSFSLYKIQFSWQPPDTLQTYTYAYVVGDTRGTTKGKSVTLKFPRTGSINACVQSVTSNGEKSLAACKSYKAPVIDSLRVKFYTLEGNPLPDTVIQRVPFIYCVFEWIRSKVIRDPVANTELNNLEPVDTISYTGSCLPYIPSSKIWSKP